MNTKQNAIMYNPGCVPGLLQHCHTQAAFLPYNVSTPSLCVTLSGEDGHGRSDNAVDRDGVCREAVGHRRTAGRVSQEFSSISFHFRRIRCFLSSTLSRFEFWLFSRSARRHSASCVFASLHMPAAFQMKPLAWHSSNAIINCSQAVSGALLERCVILWLREAIELTSVVLGMQERMHCGGHGFTGFPAAV